MGMPLTFVLSSFNQAHKRMDGLYHAYAKSVGLTDTAFWLLYTLYESDRPCTQKDLGEVCFYAPQTINSAMKALEDKGLIRLELAPESRKNKHVLLTNTGEKLLKQKIAPLVQAEERSFDRLTEQERKALLGLTEKHIGLLQEEINRIASSED